MTTLMNTLFIYETHPGPINIAMQNTNNALVNLTHK